MARHSITLIGTGGGGAKRRGYRDRVLKDAHGPRPARLNERGGGWGG
jgi:hypothetical protein